MPPAEQLPETLAREETERGSIAVRRRRRNETTVYELIVNGHLMMDTEETSTEQELARLGTPPGSDPARVVVGGLGLGFTVQELLGDDRVRHIDVVELEQCVVDWIAADLVPQAKGLLTDERVDVHVADILDWIPALPDDSVDAVLLDVDNGPHFLVHKTNSGLYEREYGAEVHRVLRPGGILVVWSASPARDFPAHLRQTFGSCEETHLITNREGEDLDYYLYAATKRAI